MVVPVVHSFLNGFFRVTVPLQFAAQFLFCRFIVVIRLRHAVLLLELLDQGGWVRLKRIRQQIDVNRAMHEGSREGAVSLKELDNPVGDAGLCA